jgi:glycine/D-amino acid oxidase-like deaminating enzyme
VDVLVVGAGIFGVTAALELAKRAHRVRVIDPGPLPHPLAASTDLSKAVRLEYGADAEYVALGERALDGWRRWNRDFGDVLYHETGVLFMRASPAGAGTFEGDSFATLRARGHEPERVTPALMARFPAFAAARVVDGIAHAVGGWVESGRAVERLLAEARAAGVAIEGGRACARIDVHGSRAVGVVTADGARLAAERVVIAAGSWTPHVLPETAPFLRSTAQPVFHLRPAAADASLFEAHRFPVFGADISTTGYYGFPIHPRAGVVKIANHGHGRVLHPESPARVVTDEETAALRAFLRAWIPALAEAPIVGTRVCLYCDTPDGHFWIDADPAREGLVLATGGSGHAYKFAPALGAIIADAVEGRPHAKFRWRAPPPRSEEAARQKA